MPTRIAIIADAHVKDDGPRAQLLAEAVRRIESCSCDGVVLLGDTVSSGLAAEYEIARSTLHRIWRLLRPMVGNHEVQEGTRSDFRAAWHVEPFTADLIENMPVMRFDTAIASQPEDEAWGVVDEPQLKLCEAVLSSRRHLPGLLFAHHPLSNTVRRSEEKNFCIENSNAVRTLLERHPAPAVVFSAHTHVQSVRREARLTAIGCPPLGFWPHAFLVVDVSTDTVEFQTHQLITSLHDSPDPDAQRPEYRLQSEGDSSDREGTVKF